MKIFLLLVIGYWLFFAPGLQAQDSEASVLFLSGVPEPHAYTLFATSGWDGAWYVGYDTAWIKRFPPIKNRDEYAKAFIGAKIGRAKTKEKREEGKFLGKFPVQGRIMIGISSKPKWKKKKNSYLLVNNKDIPLEGDTEVALEDVGEARWFWREVPLKLISKSTYNWVGIWSPDKSLTSPYKPVLAGAWSLDEKKSTTWTAKIKGVPPESLGSQIFAFDAAMAIKLVSGEKISPMVKIINMEDIEKWWAGKPAPTRRGDLDRPTLVKVDVEGKDITRAWIEIREKKRWRIIGRYLFSPPFIFRLKNLPEGKFLLRAAASDWSEATGFSKEIEISIKK